MVEPVTAGIAAGSAILNLLQQGQQQRAMQDALQAQYEGLRLQRQQADRQYELATASRQMPDGSTEIYVPGKGWIAYDGPEVATRRSMDDQLRRAELVRQLSVGEPERNREATQRAREFSTAEPLLAQFANGWGMPTRSGVRGAQTVADVTAASEGNDLRRSAATAAALRQGGSTSLGQNLSAMDRAGTAGIRTALAQAPLKGDQMFEAMYKAAAGNRLDPYKALNSGASVYKGGDVGGTSASDLQQAATVAAMRGGGSEAIARGYAGLNPALYAGAAHGPNYDTFGIGLANLYESIFGNKSEPNQSPIPDYKKAGGWNVGGVQV